MDIDLYFFSLTGRDYVFDVKRTSREAHDHARRLLYQPVPLVGTTEKSLISEKESHDCDSPTLGVEEKCQVMLPSFLE
jgi:hypothetical protein